MKTLHRSACCIVAWTLVSAPVLHAQNSTGQLASNSRGLNPAYGQVGPTGYQAPSPQAQYYTPGEYLPTPGSRLSTGTQPTAPAPVPTAPQPPYAYPAAPAPKIPATSPTPAKPQGKPAEDLEALRRENHLLNERLRAQMAQDNRGYLSPPSTLNYVNHTVRRGDTVWGLAIKYKSSSAGIQQANNLPKGKLLRGSTIRIPVQSTATTTTAAAPAYYTPMPPPQYQTRASAKPAAAAPAPAKPTVTAGTHLVRSGETLGILSQHYGVSLSELRSANRLRSSHWIYVGQRLVIPGRSDAEIAELSKKTIPTAAPSSSRPQQAPYAYPGKAQPYTAIAASTPAPKISTAKPAPAASPPAAPKPAASSSNRGVTSYRIQQGDTLPSVAKAYKISPTELRAFNRLPSDELPAPGKTLLVPTPAIVSL